MATITESDPPAAELVAGRIVVFISVAAEPANSHAFSLQYVGGFYPAGAVIALQIKAGPGCTGVGEVLLNPADPADLPLLLALSEQPQVIIQAAPAAPNFPYPRPEQAADNRPLQRRELRALLGKAAGHLPQCILDWDAARRSYAADSQIDWAVSQAV